MLKPVRVGTHFSFSIPTFQRGNAALDALRRFVKDDSLAKPLEM